MRRLATVPGVGGLTAHASVAATGAGKPLSAARDFAAGCGLTPRDHSRAGRQGDSRLRKLVARGASTIMRHARSRAERARGWPLKQFLAG